VRPHASIRRLPATGTTRTLRQRDAEAAVTKLKKGSRQLVDEAKARIKTISLDAARARHAKGEAVFVDLRDVR
jgi:hypothetical protein